ERHNISREVQSVMYRVARILALLAAVCSGYQYAAAHPSGTEPALASQEPALASQESARRNGQATQTVLWRPGLTTPPPAPSPWPQTDAGQGSNGRSEPFGLHPAVALPINASGAAAKWADIQSRIANEQKAIESCRSGDRACPAAARRFLSIVEQGLQSHGRARLGLINRAVNLSVKPVTDWSQHWAEDFWSS